MDFDLNDDQRALVTGLQGILQTYADIPARDRLNTYYHPAALQETIRNAGYLDVIASGLSTLDAGLVVLEAARLPAALEVGASALVWPSVVPDRAPAGPIALIAGDLSKAVRFLPIARHALVDTGDDLLLVDIGPTTEVEAVASVLAYPMGRFASDPLRGARALGADARRNARRRWRVAMALEFAGAAEAALRFTVDYVNQRHVFGRPIGSFQAVQHRLAQCHVAVQGMRYAALYAAATDSDEAANIAGNSALRHAGKLAFDLHQFNGGMGVTNEHLLHFWTHRLRALQGELGGAQAAAFELADALWPRSDASARSAQKITSAHPVDA